MIEGIIKDLETVKDGCLWLSGGKDSRLLLEVAQLAGIELPILRFEEGWTRQQHGVVNELIARYGLSVYSYPPVNAQLMGENGELALVAVYAVGEDGGFVPLTRDIVDGDRCAFDVKVELAERPIAPILYNTHIIGAKFSDRMPTVFGDHQTLPAKRFKVGKIDILAPLAKWTDDEVLAALAHIGIDYKQPSDDLDTGNISMCTRCLRSGGMEVMCPKTGEMVGGVEWSPEGNLAVWREVNGIR